MNRFQHWLVMVILCLSGRFIFMLPFLREVYYIPMQQAFGYPGAEGYRYFYLAIAGLCAPGTVDAYIILRRTSPRSRL
jgi:hypothetical protein